MSPAVAHEIERPPGLFGPIPAPTPTRVGGGAPSAARAEPTLADLIAGTWEGLRQQEVTACPMCHGALRPRWGAGPAPVAGRCEDCGTELT